MTDDLTALAADAYVYGYPLVCNLDEIESLSAKGLGAVPPAPYNTFGHARELADPCMRFVSINNDTLYSMAPLDLSGGPLLLHVPDTDGAYYVLQFIDAWTDNVAYVGRRATGTGEGTYLVTGPGWTGAAPEGVPVIAMPTAVGAVVGRNACAGPDDLARVEAIQRRLTLTPTGTGHRLAGLPAPDPDVPAELLFWEKLRVRLAANPPAADDLAHQRRFKPLGLLSAGPSPYADPDDRLAAALAAGAARGGQHVDQLSRTPFAAPVDGWVVDPHGFDYNRHFFGIGTLDSPQWKISDPHRAYELRAAAARAGLWGNHGYEAVYAMTYTDGGGQPLDGTRAYRLRFTAPPPVEAFWSVTMYDLPDFYLVGNPIGRYSIGDRTPGLTWGDDDSLTIALQPDRPAGDLSANWLPTPPGPFRPVLRMYQPRPEILDGTYRIPPHHPRLTLHHRPAARAGVGAVSGKVQESWPAVSVGCCNEVWILEDRIHAR
ncbi:hypothetical protein Cs7R123_20420 [Catellatospora sp. TT07R-123]|uniref:DUF1254 domain-containing protein n=1 Tax=Catellatospora sp. TT07R-123 TaxID=2733863 RepID=UPI001B227566|nr:DUF1254 domain-containing protein [Catellatospora sp. TT07R-123]GHJ44700.1 hypothetical protein Cs7R123_20420 [Catellatospora sp. TT07R-123]